ncbi:MAG: acyl-CoA dehydrogenase [bacterium]|nr:acyl-CoA dehydrogenase [bacterium]
MDIRFSAEDEAFRKEIAAWLAEQLSGEFASVRGRGGPGDEHAMLDERRAWERRLGEAGWTCVGWPQEYGTRGLSLNQQVIYYEEYARAGGPGRVGYIGEGLLGPTLIAFGSDELKRRFLPGIVKGEQIWCQGYSEPNAGSDMANVQTRAYLDTGTDGDEWRINGQKVWTSWAAWADWCFVLCRTDPDAKPKQAGISYLLVPMKQDGVEIRQIVQLTGDSEFSEVFYSDARTAADNIVGEVNGGWKVANGTLAFERGAATLGQQMAFANELQEIIACAKRTGAADDPIMRQRIADAWIGLRIQRFHALRTLSGAENAQLGPEGMITKIFWATWHRNLGKLAMDVLGAESEITEGAPYQLTPLQRMYLFTRSDTLYAGTNQIQRNIISERVLGLPREPH